MRTGRDGHAASSARAPGLARLAAAASPEPTSLRRVNHVAVLIVLAGAGRKTVALVGDGGFALSMTELWTAVQERADLCTIVMDDARIFSS